jgi:hypothetical protein
MYATLRPCRRCGNLFPLSVGLLRPVGYDWHATLGVVYECMYRAACDAFVHAAEKVKV